MKKIATLLLFLFVSSIIQAQCVSGDCENGFGVKKIDNNTYTGFFKNGLYHGIGHYAYVSGESYYGEWFENVKQGFGIYFWKDMSHYFGNFENEQRKGKGIYVNAENSYSAGIWDSELIEKANSEAPTNNLDSCSSNCINGLGFYYSSGDLKYGLWKDGKFDFGKMFENDILQLGSFSNSKIQNVAYEKTNEGIYVGHFSNGKRHGQGIYWPNVGSKMAGIWTDGEISKPSIGETTASLASKIEKDFCTEISIYAQWEDKDLKALEVEKENWFSFDLKKKFLGKYSMVYDEGLLGSYQYLEIEFPLIDNNGYVQYHEVVEQILKSCGHNMISETTSQQWDVDGRYAYLSKNDKNVVLKFQYIIPVSGCLEGDCINGPGKRKYSDAVFEGSFKDKDRHGKGVYTFDDGWKYVGEWINNKMEGHFLWHKNDTLRYEGNVSNSKRNGFGKYFYTSGNSYEGNWKDGQRSGEGKFFYKSGTILEGEFKEGKPVKGIETYIEGDRYEGEFKDWKRHGQGKAYFNNGNSYEGEFVEGLKNGQGTFYYQSGTVYKGNFSNDDIEGYGIEKYKDGSRYEGNYKNWKRNGQGTYFYASGNKYVGEWKDGVEHGHGTIYWVSSGSRYEGDFVEGIREGNGKYYWENGDWYSGKFKNNKRHGYGTYNLKNGNRYSCNWVESKEEGTGTLYYKDGGSKSIQFKNGELIE